MKVSLFFCFSLLVFLIFSCIDPCDNADLRVSQQSYSFVPIDSTETPVFHDSSNLITSTTAYYFRKGVEYPYLDFEIGGDRIEFRNIPDQDSIILWYNDSLKSKLELKNIQVSTFESDCLGTISDLVGLDLYHNDTLAIVKSKAPFGSDSLRVF